MFTANQRAELVVDSQPPAELGPRDIAGRTLVTLVSPGTELNWGYCGSEFPTQPGYAAVFRVEQMGEEVKGFEIGDVVFMMGNHHSHQRTDYAMAVRVPEGLVAERAVLARLMAVSMTTLVTTTARPPQTVAVTGLGPVGHLAALMFDACGYEVVGVDPSQARRQKMARHQRITVMECLPEKDHPLIGRVTCGLECSGVEQAALDLCRVVKERGEVVLIGVPWKRRCDLQAFEVMHAVFHKYAVLRSGWEWELPRREQKFTHTTVVDNFRGAMKWLAEGRIDVEGLVECVDPRDCQRVYQDLLHQRGEALSAVFDWRLLTQGA